MTATVTPVAPRRGNRCQAAALRRAQPRQWSFGLCGGRWRRARAPQRHGCRLQRRRGARHLRHQQRRPDRHPRRAEARGGPQGPRDRSDATRPSALRGERRHEAFQSLRMGDHAPGAGAVHDPADRRRRPVLVLQARPRRRPLVHHQGHEHPCRLARRDRVRAADPGRRQDREEAAGTAASRPRHELFAARHRLHPGLPVRHHAAAEGEGPLVSGAQEGRRHPRRSAGGHHRPELQRRVRRRLFGALHDDGRRPEPRRPEEARRGHSPGPAAGSGRQQGRPDRRAAGKDLHRVQPRQARDARHHPAADLRQRGAAERRHRRRIGRDLRRPHPPARDRRVLRRRGDRRGAGAGGWPGVPAGRHRDRQARLRGPAGLPGARGRQARARHRRLDAGRRQHPGAGRRAQEGDEVDHRRASGRHRDHPGRRPAAHRRRIGVGIPQDLRRGARHRAAGELPDARACAPASWSRCRCRWCWRSCSS